MKAPAERGREGSGKRELVYVSQEVQHVVHYMIAVMHYQPAHSTQGIIHHRQHPYYSIKVQPNVQNVLEIPRLI